MASEFESVHCVPYSQNELLQYIILAKSIGPLYVVYCHILHKQFYINNYKQTDVLDNHYLIQTEVMCKTNCTFSNEC